MKDVSNAAKELGRRGGKASAAKRTPEQQKAQVDHMNRIKAERKLKLKTTT